jgi:flagellin
MRINTNVSALNAHKNLTATQNAATESMTRLSSGFRINRAGDDAAGLSIANNPRTNTRSLTMASRNIEQANSMLQIAEGAGGSIEKIVERMKELAVQAATDTNDSRRGTLDSAVQALVKAIDRIANSTEFQGTKLIDGTFTNMTLQIGAGNTANEQLTVSIGDLKAATLGLYEDASGENAITLKDIDGAQRVLATIDGGSYGATPTVVAEGALAKVNAVLSNIGATQNRLDFAQENVKTAIVNISAAESTIRDVDMAEEMSRFSKNQILAQAGTAMLAQANQSAQNVLQLLR